MYNACPYCGRPMPTSGYCGCLGSFLAVEGSLVDAGEGKGEDFMRRRLGKLERGMLNIERRLRELELG